MTDPDELFGDALAAAAPKWQDATSSIPMPGMETTENERAGWLSEQERYEDHRLDFGPPSDNRWAKTLRDLDRALAEIARLTAALADTTEDYLRRHKDATDRAEELIACKVERDMFRDKWQAERDACADIAKSMATWPGLDTALTIERKIRARTAS